MSKEQTSSQKSKSIYELANVLERVSPGIGFQKLKFIIAWYLAGDKEEDRPFGFLESRGIIEQAQEAVKFLNEAQKDWHDHIFQGMGNLKETKFIDFFINRIQHSGITLSPDFKNKHAEELDKL